MKCTQLQCICSTCICRVRFCSVAFCGGLPQLFLKFRIVSCSSTVFSTTVIYVVSRCVLPRFLVPRFLVPRFVMSPFGVLRFARVCPVVIEALSGFLQLFALSNYICGECFVSGKEYLRITSSSLCRGLCK